MDDKIIESITLGYGYHPSPNDGLCLMEAVAYLAGEPHSYRPQCASPVLSAFGSRLNDGLPHEQRQRLKQFIPQLVGTRKPELESRRMFFLIDRAVRVFAPTALRAASAALENNSQVEHAENLKAEAEKLEMLPVIDYDAADSAWSAANAAVSASGSAWCAVKSAAESAEFAKYATEYAAANPTYAVRAPEHAFELARYAAAYAAATITSAVRAAEYASYANLYDAAIEVFAQAIDIHYRSTTFSGAKKNAEDLFNVG